MFYSQFILAKKGPLGTIWIAAHLERKLRKNQVADTDIGVSVDSILFPEVPIALRLSSHLLLGLVRIYSRKVNYLFNDCSEALLKIKQAFRSTAVDLPPEESKAPYHSITLPETFDLDDFELPDTELFQGNFVDHHVSTKEQITLQDTMDGVVYSTSQFGLDERFGDGDASQIGLDLDEELLLNKGASSNVLLTSHVDPQASFEPSSTQKGDELDEEMHQASQAIATNCFIEAPSTPGLVEGPNLPITQEALVSDDHMEEDHNPIELGAEVKGGSTSSHVESGIDQAALLENGCALGNQKIDKSRSQVGSPSTTMPMELINSNIAHISGSNKAFESSEGMDAECLQNGSLGKSDLSGALAVKHSGEGGEAEEIGLNGTMVPVCKPILQACNFQSNQQNVELDNVLSMPNLLSKDFGVGPAGMSGEEDASDASVAKVKDITNMKLNEDHSLDLAPCNKIDGQPVISENVHFEKGSDSVASELPSPEKMLSLPDLPVSQPNELFVGSTPEREGVLQADQDATINKISGKKRSLTESTITLQSLNTAESSEAAQSKRTVDFVPDDDDLLSSILVGRRSTALKVKSTPLAFDLVSSKRRRVTPRSGPQKRKVLLDDSMVLHGDTIRQQLVNTEDIRRVRKKAPSTHPEIWILQKQFLEDEMFSESIFTGMSAELIALHHQPFDLSEIKLVEDDDSKAQTTTTDITGTPIKPTVGEETKFEGTSVPSVARDEIASQSAGDNPIQASLRVSADLGGNTPENERMNDEVGHAPSQFDISENRIEMEMECRREPVGDEADNEKDILPIEDTSILGRAFGEGVVGAADGDIVEHRSEERNSVVGMEDVDSAVPKNGAQPDSSLPVNDENIIAEDRISNEGRTHEPVTINKEKLLESDLKFDDRSLFLDHLREDLKTDSSNPIGGDLSPGYDVFSEVVDLHNQFAESHIFLDTTATASDHPTSGNLNDLEADAIVHDTDFLNFDDEEIAEGDNSMPNAEGPQILDNSGWSTRTRAVANYLQVLFQKEAQHGRKYLHVDNLLVNKSRKEASRMFFETLVLKTRDYIHVEQEGPFGNIIVKPRARLLKSEF